ncbi:MAG: Ser/Thr protein phosphatase [Candidatus Improbicoccus pseudotrichonymphae]|uniref:Ser/Thr protein phosphatase n=1 Tax=Candidatus Improbicoccus pseudotrichonymphae TaxID=3033792 RepID=A0AA48I2D5_9FIRM|nr:MAG: Ser/Thr protein phosphatase [Candidatus Improbicoccus pseudotrichonymphae]
MDDKIKYLWDLYHFLVKNVISAHEFKESIEKLCGLLISEEPYIKIKTSEVLVVGDVHGDFNSHLLTALETVKSGGCVVFLGDYIDRGSNSIEVLCWLFQFKLFFPKDVFLLSGNHESVHCGSCTFPEEITSKYSEKDYDLETKIYDLFNFLGAAAEIHIGRKTLLVCHACPISNMIECNDRIEFENNINSEMKKPHDRVSNFFWDDISEDVEEIQTSHRGDLYKIYPIRIMKDYLKKFGYSYIIRGHDHSAQKIIKKNILASIATPIVCPHDLEAGIWRFKKNSKPEFIYNN